MGGDEIKYKEKCKQEEISPGGKDDPREENMHDLVIILKDVQ